MQQGGSPSPYDRLLATRLVARAFEQLVGQFERGDRGAYYIGQVGNAVEARPVKRMFDDLDIENRRPFAQWWLDLVPVQRIVSLQNPGIDKVIEEELPKLSKCLHKKVMANVGGFSVEEYVEVCRRLDACDQVGWLEVNVSCPNVHGGGIAFGTDPDAAAQVVSAVKDAVRKPVIVKLSPNVTDIVSIAKACENAGADGISLINTMLGMRIDLRTRKPVVANIMGGFSGPAVFPVALRMVYQVYEAVDVPIIGIGGVSTASDVIEMMLAGATAVQIGAANLTDPYVCRDIVLQLPETMKKYGISDLREITGGAH